MDLFKKDFKITSLEAVSPRYASESVDIETTFQYIDGNVTPTEINLTIYDPNDNEWATATKADFRALCSVLPDPYKSVAACSNANLAI